jgi:hypothetical protein
VLQAARNASGEDIAIPLFDRAESLAKKLTEVNNRGKALLENAGIKTPTKIADEELQVLQAKEEVLTAFNKQNAENMVDEKELQASRLNFEAAIKKDLETRITSEKAISTELERQNKTLAEMIATQEMLITARNKNREGVVESRQKALGAIRELQLKRASVGGLAEALEAGDFATIKKRILGTLIPEARTIGQGDIRNDTKVDLPKSMALLEQIKVLQEEIANIEKAKKEAPVLDKSIADLKSMQDKATEDLKRFVGKFYPDLLKEVNEAAAKKMQTAAETWRIEIDKLKKLMEAAPGEIAIPRGVGRATGGLIGGNSYDGVNFRGSGQEFIMNRDITSRMAPYFLAMNSGRGATAGRDVGNYYNQNVTVNEAKSPDLTSKAVARSLRRGVKRGNFRLS